MRVNIMSESQLSLLPVQPTRRRGSTRKRSEYLVFHCVIASRSAERQEAIARAVAESGWEPVVCSDAEAVHAHQSRRFAQLAIIDLESDSSGEFQNVTTRLAATRDLLTVVCGHENNQQEELHARQSGAWVYLPGVNDSSALSQLCSEAKQLVERMQSSKDRNSSRRLTA